MVSFTKLASLVLGAAATATAGLAERQLHTLPLQGASSLTTAASSATSPTTSSSSPTAPTSSSTSPRTPSSTHLPTTPSTTPATQTGAALWELTTVFTQPTDCINGITQYAGDLSTLGNWLNIPHPAPGLTLTSCFPPALVASVTAAVDLPPYEQLVCPFQWESLDYNSTYRICCPYGFSFDAPGLVSNTDRPGLGAWCTSWAPPGTHAVFTSYLTNGESSVFETKLGTGDDGLVWATAFDGIIATAVGTSKPSGTATTSSASSDSSLPLSKTSTPETPTMTSRATTTLSTKASPTGSGATAVAQLFSCGMRYLMYGLAGLFVVIHWL